MNFIKKHIFQLATTLFLILSIVSGVILVKQEQDLRELAQYEGCECAAACPTNGGCYRVRCPVGHPNAGESDINGGAGNCPAQGVTCPPGKTYNSSLGTCDDGNTGSGQVSPQPDPSSHPNQSSPVANPNAASWTCQVCSCSSLTNGECRSNCSMVPCSSAVLPSCGQIDACPPGQSSAQCGAANENRRVGTNCTTTSTSPAPTSPPPSITPTRIPSTPTPIPPTATPTRLPSTPTQIPPTATPIPKSCGSSCANQTCNTGLNCVETSTGSFCARPIYETACRQNPNSSTCCLAPSNTPTPTSTQTPTPSPSPTPSPTNTITPSPTATPIPKSCGSSCDNQTCASGLTCVGTSNGQNFCARPAYESACRDNPSATTCCLAPTSTPVPTATPAPSSTPRPTSTPRPIVLSCGQTGCDQAGKSCGNNLLCIKTTSGIYRCGKEELEPTCVESNTSSACCNLPTTALAAKEPNPTRISLPVSGVDAPLKTVTIFGVIVTLLGVLLML